MKTLSDFTVNELRNAIWVCSLGNVPVGGYDVNDYRNELKRRGLSKKGYHNS